MVALGAFAVIECGIVLVWLKYVKKRVSCEAAAMNLTVILKRGYTVTEVPTSQYSRKFGNSST